MSRSKWKGPFINITNKKNNNNSQTSIRNSLVVPSLSGQVLKVHDGKGYFELTVNKDMLGRTVGEFIFTRAKFSYKKKKVKK